MSVVRVTSLLIYFSSADLLSFSLPALILWEFFLRHSLDQAFVLRFLWLFLMLLCRKTSSSSFWVSCGTHVIGYGSCHTDANLQHFCSNNNIIISNYYSHGRPNGWTEDGWRDVEPPWLVLRISHSGSLTCRSPPASSLHFPIRFFNDSVILFFLMKYPDLVILLILNFFKYPEPMVLSFCFFFFQIVRAYGYYKKIKYPPHNGFFFVHNNSFWNQPMVR